MKMWNGLIGVCVILGVATLAASAGESHGNQALTNAPITVTGTLQAEGKSVSLQATNGTVYVVRGGKALVEKAGQEVTLTGIVREMKGKKVLLLRKPGKEKDAKNASAPPPAPAK